MLVRHSRLPFGTEIPNIVHSASLFYPTFDYDLTANNCYMIVIEVIYFQ
jgi:hypothetical protein